MKDECLKADSASCREAMRKADKYAPMRKGTNVHRKWLGTVLIHSTIRCTPAMAAGVASTVWSMGELVDAALARTEEL